MQGSAPVNRKGRWKRPPAALFDPSKVADRISNSGSFVVFEGNQYDSAGFLRKDFRINAVVGYFSSCDPFSPLHYAFTESFISEMSV